MKNLFYLLFVLPLLFSCGDTSGNAIGDSKIDEKNETAKQPNFDDASGDAIGDSKIDEKNETAEQPNCDDIDGLQYDKKSKWSNDYTGVAFQCVDGKVARLFNIKNGKREGLSKRWRSNGNYQKGNYKNDNPDGSFKTWNANGQLISESNYKDNMANGWQRDWHENGQLKYQCYAEGADCLSKKCWDENGNEVDCY